MIKSYGNNGRCCCKNKNLLVVVSWFTNKKVISMLTVTFLFSLFFLMNFTFYDMFKFPNQLTEIAVLHQHVKSMRNNNVSVLSGGLGDSKNSDANNRYEYYTQSGITHAVQCNTVKL